jgi:hypothetical protein
MKTNPHLLATLMEVLDNQLNELNPPETMETLNRLIASGYSDEEARRFICAAILAEMNAVLKTQEIYNPARYIATLHKLPELPGD